MLRKCSKASLRCTSIYVREVVWIMKLLVTKHMIALKTSPVLFGLVMEYYQFSLCFIISYLFHDRVLYSLIFKKYYILSIFLLLNCFCQLSMEFSSLFYHVKLCDTLSGYSERPNNNDSNFSHCFHWRHVYILVSLVCNIHVQSWHTLNLLLLF